MLECEAGRDIIKSELSKSIAIVKRRNKLKNKAKKDIMIKKAEDRMGEAYYDFMEAKDKLDERDIKIAQEKLDEEKKYYEWIKSTDVSSKEQSQIDFRLYVDGDFHSKQCLLFWMSQIKDNPILSAYGYSKSFGLFLNLHNEGFKFPKNYVLNISSGSKYNQSIIDKMLKLPMVRDQFVAVTMPYKVTTEMHSNKEHQKRLRQEYKKINPLKKVFACGGLCGECTNKKHACGDMRFQGVPILIGVH